MINEMMSLRGLLEERRCGSAARDDRFCRRVADGVGGGGADRRPALASATPLGNATASTSCATSWPTPGNNAAAHAQWRLVTDQLRPRAHKLADLMDGAEMNVLAYMDFLLEQNDEWAVQRSRYITLETIRHRGR